MPLYQLFSSKLTSNKADYPAVADNYNPQNTINQNSEDYDLLDTNFYQSRDRFTLRIPFYILSNSDYRKIKTFGKYFAHKLIKNNDYTLYVALPVHSVKLTYDPYKFSHPLQSVLYMYEPTYYVQYHNQKQFIKTYKSQASIIAKNFTVNPKTWLDNHLAELCSQFNLDLLSAQNNLETFWQNYSLADQLNQQAKLFQNNLADLFSTYGQNIDWCQNLLNNCSYYDLPLAQYKNVYSVLKQLRLTNRDYTKVVSTNEYLLLISNIEQLHKKEKYLPTIKSGNVQINPHYNSQQKAAIIAPYALNLLQSVAGSGKSTTILGRIKYLIDNNIKPDSITVLSFTNAAANHIKQQFNSVTSLTIAKLIHDIYQANYHHHLSNTDTLINSLYLKYGETDLIINQFIKHLLDMSQNKKQAMTKALHFIATNEQEITKILNSVKQTSLELEEIFCYLHLNDWQNPYQTKYLIVDEVQDTSVFQFIYLLKYAAVNKTNVFFVGDASQTLYEFRDADPSALNALEATNYFHAFRLETNYRSHPAILLYANQVLKTLNANRYANLRLKPAKNTNLTGQCFMQNAKYMHYDISRLNQASLEKLFNDSNLTAFINHSLKTNEKLAILTRSRKLASQVQATLSTNYPQVVITNITSQLPAQLNILSNYLRLYGPEINYMPTTTLPQMLLTAITGKLESLWPHGVYDSAKTKLIPYVQDMLANLKQDLNNKYPILFNKYQKGIIKHNTLSYAIKQYLLNYEIDYNLAMQDQLNQITTDTEKQIENADIITSTIHGTKGLEFDNVILLTSATNNLSQADKRLLYVALTRAKKHEFIIEASHTPYFLYQKYQDCLKYFS